MPCSSDESGSDEYKPDTSDTESDSAREHVNLYRRASSPLLTKDAQWGSAPFGRSSRILTRSCTRPSPNMTAPCGASQMKTTKPIDGASRGRVAKAKSRMPTNRPHRKLSSSTSDSDSSTAPVRGKKQAIHKAPKLEKRQPPVKRFDTERDPLFRALARGVELLADLHMIKHWLETAGHLRGTVSRPYHKRTQLTMC